MARIIDADSHFMEPLDLWERYIEPRYRSRCLRFERDPQSGRHVMLINEGKRIRGVGEYSMEDMLGAKRPIAPCKQPAALSGPAPPELSSLSCWLGKAFPWLSWKRTEISTATFAAIPSIPRH